MNDSTRSQGFTLIELVVVIVILGILSVTAIPKFIDISADANKAVLEAMGRTILSSSKFVYANRLC
jgi:MSHA pilin protein MshA